MANRNPNARSDGARPESQRAAAEVAPREIETSGAGAGAGMGAQRAVDESRPADVVGQAGIGDTTYVSAPRMAPNVLHRQHLIAPQSRPRAETPGEELSEEDREALAAHRGDATT